MGGAAGSELAAAVSNAGAPGSIPIWTVAPEAATDIIKATSALTDRPFTVNVRADLGQVSHVRSALDGGVRLVHLFWGDPTPYVRAIRAARARVIVTVANSDEAKQALDAGADILIAQGWEAGGHVRGNLTTLALVPTVVDLAGPVPVLAAGGIIDGRGLTAAIAIPRLCRGDGYPGDSRLPSIADPLTSSRAPRAAVSSRRRWQSWRRWTRVPPTAHRHRTTRRCLGTARTRAPGWCRAAPGRRC